MSCWERIVAGDYVEAGVRGIKMIRIKRKYYKFEKSDWRQ